MTISASSAKKATYRYAALRKGGKQCYSGKRPSPIVLDKCASPLSNISIAVSIAMASPQQKEKPFAGLAGVLNTPEDNRDYDSAYYSAYYSAKDSKSMFEISGVADARTLLTTI